MRNPQNYNNYRGINGSRTAGNMNNTSRRANTNNRSAANGNNSAAARQGNQNRNMRSSRPGAAAGRSSINVNSSANINNINITNGSSNNPNNSGIPNNRPNQANGSNNSNVPDNSSNQANGSNNSNVPDNSSNQANGSNNSNVPNGSSNPTTNGSNNSNIPDSSSNQTNGSNNSNVPDNSSNQVNGSNNSNVSNSSSDPNNGSNGSGVSNGNSNSANISSGINPALCAAVHRMRPGETLYQLSRRYKIDYHRLMVLNNITDPQNIPVGKEICIPPVIHSDANRPAYPGANNGRPGQRPGAGRPRPNNGVSGNNRPGNSRPGAQNENSSSNDANCNEQLTHTIASGDTLYSISRKYNVPLNALMRANHNIDPYNLRIGKKLCIPSVQQNNAAAENGNTQTQLPANGDTGNSGNQNENGQTENTGSSGAQSENNQTSDIQNSNSASANSQTSDMQGSNAASANDPISNSDISNEPNSDLNSANDQNSNGRTDIADTYNDNYSDPDYFEANIPETNNAYENYYSDDGIYNPEDDYAAYENSINDDYDLNGSEDYDNFNDYSYSYIQADNLNNINNTDPEYQSANSPISTYVSDNSADGIIYNVSDNETLTEILSKFGICYYALLNENPGADLSGSLDDMTLCIPYEDRFRKCPQNQEYIVKTGDSLAKIAEDNGLSTDELLIMNPTRNTLDFSIIGSKICINK